MTLTLYVNTSPTNFVNKTKTVISTVEGVLREGCSIVDPVLDIESSGSPGTTNYAYLSEYDRFYFVKEWVSIAKGLWRVYLHCDVLSTFWNKGISQSKCICARNSYQRQDDLVDEQMYFTADSLYAVYNFPQSPFTGNAGQRNYVVLLSGSDA